MNEPQHRSVKNVCSNCSAPISFRTLAFSSAFAPFFISCPECKTKLMGTRWVWWSAIIAAFLAATMAAMFSFLLIFVSTLQSSPDWSAAALISIVGAILSYLLVLRYGSFITAALLATIVSAGLGVGGFVYSTSPSVPSVASLAAGLVFVLILVGVVFLSYFIIRHRGRFLVRENVRIARISALCLALLLGLVIVAPLAVLGGFAVAGVIERNVVERTRESLEVTGTSEVFSADLVSDLPNPARRYFLHAIQPGTSLASSVELEISGSAKFGADWDPFTARLLLAPERGFVSEAMYNRQLLGKTDLNQIIIYYLDGKARRHIKYGWLGGSTRAGVDYSKTAARTLAVKSALYLPASLLTQRGATWEAIDDGHAKVTLTVNGEPIQLTLTIDPDGRLQEVAIEPSRLRIEGESTFGGYTIPLQVYSELSLDRTVEARFK